MADTDLVAMLRARLQTGGEDFLAHLVAELGLPAPAVSPALSPSLSGRRRSGRQSRPPARLSPPLEASARLPGRARRVSSAVGTAGAGGALAPPPPAASSSSTARSVRSAGPASDPAPRGQRWDPAAAYPAWSFANMGNNLSSGQQSSDGGAPPTPPPSQLVVAPPVTAGMSVQPALDGLIPVPGPVPVEPLVPVVSGVISQSPAVVAVPAPTPAPSRCAGRRTRGRDRSPSVSGSSSQGSGRRSRRRTAGHGRRRARRVSGRSRRSHRSRSSRWRSPSSSEVSSELSSSPGRRSRPSSRRHRRDMATGRSSGGASPPGVVAEQAPAVSPLPEVPVPSSSGEFPFTGAWGEGSVAPGLIASLKALVNQFGSAPAAAAPAPPVGEQVRAGIHKDSFFCGISPLGSHLEDSVREKIWENKYVDIWSLISVDQHTVDRERRVFTEKPADKKPKVAHTMNNWLQAFSVLGCVMGQRHPDRCSELFVYMDSVYNAYKSHGGSAWWRYDEDFRRRLSLQPEIGWGVKATDVWLRLMMAQKSAPFHAAATVPGPNSSGAVAVRRPGACWLYNDGHCKFFGLCKYKHECSACGGTHPASRCNRPQRPTSKPSGAPSDGKDPGERPKDVAMARHLPGQGGR